MQLGAMICTLAVHEFWGSEGVGACPPSWLIHSRYSVLGRQGWLRGGEVTLKRQIFGDESVAKEQIPVHDPGGRFDCEAQGRSRPLELK